MPVVELRDGTRIEVPDDLTREEMQWLNQNRKNDTATDVSQSIGSGLLEGAIRGPLFVGDLGNLAVRGINKVRPGTIDPEYEKFTSDRALEIAQELSGVKRYDPQTTAGRYANAGASATGGAFAMGPGAAMRLPLGGAALPGASNAAAHVTSRLLSSPVLTAPVVGMAGQAGGDLGGPVGAAAGGIGSQLALALLARQMRPNHPNWIREGTSSMTPDDWQQAFDQRRKLEQAGARSATLADAMPENAQIRGFTRDLSNSSGAQPLVQKLAGRNSPGQQVLENGQLTYQNRGDIPRLLDEAADALVPGGVNAGQVTANVADQASDAMQRSRQARANAYMPILEQGAPVPREDLAAMIQAIQMRGRTPQNLGTVDQFASEAAMRTLQRTPLYPTPRPQVMPDLPSGTDLQLNSPNWTTGQMPTGPMGANLVALSKNVKDLRQGVPTPGMPLNRAAGQSAYQMADDALKGASPDYSRAMQTYGDMTQRAVNPLREGLVGQLAKLQGRPPSENTLPNVFARTPPSEVQRYATQVAPTQEMRNQIARMLADAGNQPMKTAGSGADRVAQVRQNIVNLVDEPTAQLFSQKSGAADTLSRLTVEAGADSTARQALSQSGMAAVFAPFLELRNRLRLRMSEKETMVLANLLANPTEANMQLLQRIAQERPEVTRALSTMQRAAATSAGVQAGE